MIGSGANKHSVFYKPLSVALALFISSLLPAYTHACECLWEGSFTEVAADADL
ncbi:MAG: delta-aminolevulinic acid dehydratase, partial [Proteobacteria bacterium]